MTEKNELRKKVREEIAALDETYVNDSDIGIFSRAAALQEFKDARTVLIYYSVGREPDTIRIAEIALSLGKTVAFPYCYRGGIMQAKVVGGIGELRPAMLGIPAPPDSAPVIEPEKLDMVLVPALTFDRSGYRLGYGGGYYDRYLSGIPAFTAGLGRERLIKTALPREPHDVKVNCLITEYSDTRLR